MQDTREHIRASEEAGGSRELSFDLGNNRTPVSASFYRDRLRELVGDGVPLTYHVEDGREVEGVEHGRTGERLGVVRPDDLTEGFRFYPSPAGMALIRSHMTGD